MAKIHEEIIQITLSKLVKDNDDPEHIATSELVEQLAEVVDQLAPEGVVAEVSKL